MSTILMVFLVVWGLTAGISSASYSKRKENIAAELAALQVTICLVAIIYFWGVR